MGTLFETKISQNIINKISKSGELSVRKRTTVGNLNQEKTVDQNP